MTDDDPIARADLTRELHYMQTQVEQDGFPGTRAVLAELERLRKENARLRAMLDDISAEQAELRQIKSVRNTRHAMNHVTRIGKLASAR